MNTLFDKIWDAHVVTTVEDGPTPVSYTHLDVYKRQWQNRLIFLYYLKE